MNDLIARLEAATGPDRELDAEIECLRDGRTFAKIDGPLTQGHFQLEAIVCTVEGRSYAISTVPHYTASVDAGRTLADAGWGWNICSDGTVTVYDLAQRHEDCGGHLIIGEGKGATPDLGFLIAILRARQGGQG
jgi:hypothetical protein